MEYFDSDNDSDIEEDVNINNTNTDKKGINEYINDLYISDEEEYEMADTLRDLVFKKTAFKEDNIDNIDSDKPKKIISNKKQQPIKNIINIYEIKDVNKNIRKFNPRLPPYRSKN